MVPRLIELGIKNYKAVSGKDIDTLWGLNGALEQTPQWYSFYVPNLAENSDSNDEFSRPPESKKKAYKAITGGSADDSDGSMPELQSASNSSDEIDTEDDSDFDHYSSSEEVNDDGYNTEEEDEMREMLREAMDTAHEADWLHSADVPPEMDPFLQEDRKNNPFLKLLSSLRGMFSPLSLLSTHVFEQVVCSPRTPSLKPARKYLNRNLGRPHLLSNRILPFVSIY